MKEDDVCVFPFEHVVNNPSKGMTLRDYFAIHATHEEIKIFLNQQVWNEIEDYMKYAVQARYKYADFMLKEREKMN